AILQQLNPALAEQFMNRARNADELIRQTKATEAFKELQGRLNDQLRSFQNLTVEQSTALDLQTDKYKDLNEEQRKQILAIARQVDAQTLYRDQLEKSRQALDQFKDTVTGLFETLFNEGPKAFF